MQRWEEHSMGHEEENQNSGATNGARESNWRKAAEAAAGGAHHRSLWFFESNISLDKQRALAVVCVYG